MFVYNFYFLKKANGWKPWVSTWTRIRVRTRSPWLGLPNSYENVKKYDFFFKVWIWRWFFFNFYYFFYFFWVWFRIALSVAPACVSRIGFTDSVFFSFPLVLCELWLHLFIRELVLLSDARILDAFHQWIFVLNIQ